MLEHLRIRGLALLDDVSLDFRPGMNVLTGETGAGKSIIVDALGLLRGARARTELIRDGEQEARVEAQFAVDSGSGRHIDEALLAHAVELEDGAVIVARMIGRQGRGRCTLQDSITTLKALAEVGAELVEICSQHEHHALTQVPRHLDLLDAHAGLETCVREHEIEHRAWKAAEGELERLRERARSGRARADYLRFQIDELERVEPQPGEFESLQARLHLLRDAARLGGFAREAHEILYEADDAIAGRLSVLLERARRGPVAAGNLGEIAEQLEAARIACEEAAAAASRLANELVFEPYELERAEDRLHELDQLRRKHGCPTDELCNLVDELRSELAAIDNVEEELSACETRVSQRRRACLEMARELSDCRRAAAGPLAQAVVGELRALHIPDARLRVRFDEPWSEPAPRGFDRVEFEFSANAGEPLASLNKVASGGELSRVLLAFKSALTGGRGERVSTYVFDEVDSGVGGAVAEAIGARLYRAARDRQVLCITHLPQIAAFADAHFKVEKRNQGGRTVTRVIELDEAERVAEVARMLGGAKVTRSAQEHAVALLGQARSQRAVDSPESAGRKRKSAKVQRRK